MSDISFKSTFKIPVNQWGVNNSKKLQLKSLVSSYPHWLIANGKDKQAYLSIPDSKDFSFIRKLKKIGYYEFDQFEGQAPKKTNLESYVKKFFNKNE